MKKLFFYILLIAFSESISGSFRKTIFFQAKMQVFNIAEMEQGETSGRQ